MEYKTASKRILTIIISVFIIFSLAACSFQNGDQVTDPPAKDSGNTGIDTPSNSGGSGTQNTEANGPSTSDGATTDSKILVVYFSHTGENYSVGVIEKGNTHIIADMIAEEVGADMFEIEPVNPYPSTYDECTDVAKREQNNNARPEFAGGIDDMEQYDTVFIGYPIWWGDLPMVVYTFLESYDLSGKTIIPFCTHEGSGLSGTGHSIKSACPNATVLDGLAIRGSVAQNKQDEARADVVKWLAGFDY